LVLHCRCFANVNIVHDNWQVSLLRITMDLSGVDIWFLSILYWNQKCEPNRIFFFWFCLLGTCGTNLLKTPQQIVHLGCFEFLYARTQNRPNRIIFVC
jgi:hypothetical protein